MHNVEGIAWNHTRTYCIYQKLGLGLRIKSKKRLVREEPETLDVPKRSYLGRKSLGHYTHALCLPAIDTVRAGSSILCISWPNSMGHRPLTALPACRRYRQQAWSTRNKQAQYSEDWQASCPHPR